MSEATPNILIVDDDEPSRYTLSHYLKRAGYRTFEAKTGQEALSLAKERPDLVLLDINLPDMLGYEVCKRLKSDPLTAGIPVLHVSATYRTMADKVRALDEGADGYLGWPVEPEELVANVKVLLRLRQAEQVLRKRNERLQILSDAIAHLLTTEDYRTVVDQLFSKIAPHLNLDTYLSFVVENGGDHLSLHSSVGFDEETTQRIAKLNFGEGISGAVASNRQSVVAVNIHDSDDPQIALLRPYGIRAYVCIPLLIGDRLCGTLAFGSRTRDSFTDDELQFLRTISHHVSIALDRLRKEMELEKAKADLELQVQRRTEKLRETIQELEGFTYSITHDMRAPLRAMQGFAQLLLNEYQTKLDGEGVNHLQRISSAASRLDSLIVDVLNYGKIVRAETPLHVIDLDILVRDIIRDYPAFNESKADIHIAGRLPHVRGNEAFLTQILSNLLDNAVKFVRPGTVPRIHISADVRPDAVRICVRDNGVGIDPRHQERIFKLFERLHASDEYSGTGVGLAIVRKAVQRLGGRAGVESEPGKGSCFWIELSPP